MTDWTERKKRKIKEQKKKEKYMIWFLIDMIDFFFFRIQFAPNSRSVPVHSISRSEGWDSKRNWTDVTHFMNESFKMQCRLFFPFVLQIYTKTFVLETNNITITFFFIFIFIVFLLLGVLCYSRRRENKIMECENSPIWTIQLPQTRTKRIGNTLVSLS